MTTFSAKPGFALPAVLFIAVFGILLGFGRLLVFHNQCRLRLDRQQELEKVFAVRSAVNCLQNYSKMSELPEEGGRDGLIVMRTDSGRETKVLIHPADAIFPVADEPRHFCIGFVTESIDPALVRYLGTNYRYASTEKGEPTLKVAEADNGSYCSLTPTNVGEICRLTIDMSDTGRWSDDPFGRRYAFNVMSLCGGANEHDTLRFILRRKRQGEVFSGDAIGLLEAKEKGEQQSWRPSQNNESVIYAELKTGGSDVGSFTAWTQRYLGPPVLCGSHVVTNTAFGTEGLQQNAFGIQLVGRRLSLFQALSGGGGIFKQYNIAQTVQIPEAVYFDFTNDVKAVEAGTTTLTTNLVMELEVVGSPARGSAAWDSSLSSGNEGESATAMNQFNHFEVYPAFEFTISIENKNERMEADKPREPKLATVVHLDIDKTRSPDCTAITYDTHGTEIKGWRTDERKAWGVIR